MCGPGLPRSSSADFGADRCVPGRCGVRCGAVCCRVLFGLGGRGLGSGVGVLPGLGGRSVGSGVGRRRQKRRPSEVACVGRLCGVRVARCCAVARCMRPLALFRGPCRASGFAAFSAAARCLFRCFCRLGCPSFSWGPRHSSGRCLFCRSVGCPGRLRFGARPAVLLSCRPGAGAVRACPEQATPPSRPVLPSPPARNRKSDRCRSLFLVVDRGFEPLCHA